MTSGLNYKKISAEFLFYTHRFGKCTVTDLLSNGKVICYSYKKNETFISTTDNLFHANIRDESRCYYCQSEFSNGISRTRDHIIPLSKGGTSHSTNICYACERCNGIKGNMTPAEFLKFLAMPSAEFVERLGGQFRRLTGFNRKVIVPRVENLLLHLEDQRLSMVKL